MTTTRTRAGATTGLLEAVAAAGGRPERVLAAAGLSSEDLADPDRMIPSDRVLILFDAAAEELGDDAFGLHIGETYDFGAVGAVSYAVLNAPTVGTALANFERYARTNWHGLRLTLEVAGRTARLAHDVGLPGRERARHYAEGAAVVAVQLLRRLVRVDWAPRRVLFGHGRPARTREHARIFGAPVRFDAPVSVAIELDAADLEHPVPHADRRLLPIVQRHLDERLASARDDEEDWLTSVRERVALEVCDGPPSIETVAARLALGVRTLQRRLGERGIVFKRMVDDVRRDLALRYLADGKSDLTEIAFLVGYSELSAFDRAFRRWTGSTPKQYQRQLRDPGSAAPSRVRG
jgi:AraC-like DNA-binding protein